MRFLAARTLPYVVGVRGGAYTIGAVLLVGLLALGTLFAFGALAPPDPVERSDAPEETAPGGETVVAKLADAQADTATETEPVESAPAGRLHAAALSPMIPAAPVREEPPSLKGLSEIPRELIWNRPPDEDKKAKSKAFADFSKAREVLPWDAVEPVPFSPLAPSSAQPETEGTQQAAVAHQPLKLPDEGQVEAWVRATVTEIKGAERTRPLYHFQLWLDPPAEVKRRLVGVAYDFNTPAIRPQSQASSDQASGFRVSAGGLACADQIVVTLRFDDGRAQKVVVDGCELLS